MTNALQSSFNISYQKSQIVIETDDKITTREMRIFPVLGF